MEHIPNYNSKPDGLEAEQSLETNSFVVWLKKIKESLELLDNCRVLYPGSSNDKSVAEAFGGGYVVHVDPDEAACEDLKASGLKAVAEGIESYQLEDPLRPFGVMVALNSYGKITPEILEKLVAPSGYVITNNYTGWARTLSKMPEVELVSVVVPDYRMENAQLWSAAQLAESNLPNDLANETTMRFFNLNRGNPVEVGPNDPHDWKDTATTYPDALFVFKRTDADFS